MRPRRSLIEIQAEYILLQQAWLTALMVDPTPWAELFTIHGHLIPLERLLRLNKRRLV